MAFEGTLLLIWFLSLCGLCMGYGLVCRWERRKKEKIRRLNKQLGLKL